MTETKLASRGFGSFDELVRALNHIPNQTMGCPSAISDIGEQYEVFRVVALARPGDEKTIEQMVVKEMCEKLDQYFEGKSGRIYWRTPLETETVQHDVVLRLDVNGPDIDFITNLKCVMDKNWRKITGYCRLVKATAYVPDALDHLAAQRKIA